MSSGCPLEAVMHIWLRRATWSMSAIVITLGCVVDPQWLPAASPHAANVIPRGGQRGTEVEVHINGKNLKDAQEILSYSSDLQFSEIKALNGDRVQGKVKIDPDASLGEHAIRLRTATGISDLITFWVGPFPTVHMDPKQPPTQFEKAQKIDLNVTVEGQLKAEEIHYFAVTAKKGQRLSAEVEGIRLGGVMFDPYLALLDSKRSEIVTVDDTALLRQDSFFSILIPADGTYVIQLRDSAFASNDARYRLHVGTFPRPHVLFPCGGEVGTTVAAEFVGDVSGVIKESLQLPATMPSNATGQPGGTNSKGGKGAKRPKGASPSGDMGTQIAFYAEQENQTAPSPNYFRLCPFPNVMQIRPNQNIATATAAPTEVPLAFNGTLARAGDTDFYRFKAKKAVPVEINVFARRVRSPLDSVLTIYDSKGKSLASNDDSNGPDSYLRFEPPVDGEYLLSVTDQLHEGGPDYVYRVELTPAMAEVSLSIPPVGQQNNAGASQERQAVCVPRGNRFATLIRATRQGFDGNLILDARDLPAGVTMRPAQFAKGENEIPVIFEAAADAPVGGVLCELSGHPADPQKKNVEIGFDQAVILTSQNQITYHSLSVDKIAVAVVDEAPFKLELMQPKAPMAQGSTLNVVVRAQRKEGFKGVITCRLLNRPGGLSGAQTIDIPGDKDEILYPLTADANAPVKKAELVMLGSTNVEGQVWVSSEPITLEIAPPLVAMKIRQGSVQQGATAKLVCDIEKPRFEGTAKVELLGINGGTAEPREISATDKSVTFEVVTTDKTPPGQQTGLFCRVTVTQGIETVLQDTARGGVLRVDRKANSSSKKE